jgi:hypothetical protein
MDNIDLSLFSDADLDALEKGDLTALSDQGLAMLETAKAPKGPTTRGGVRRTDLSLRQPVAPSGRPFLPQDPRLQTAVDVRGGQSALYGIPGGALDIAAGITQLVGAEDTSRYLQGLERKLEKEAPVKETYETGKIIPAVVPYGLAAKIVSKLPVASPLAQAALQTLGQAGTAYAVTPEKAPTFEDLVTEKEKSEGVFGLGPRGEAALMAGALTLPFEVAPLALSSAQRFAQKFRTTGPMGATPAEEAALRVTREQAPAMAPAEAELAAAREREQAADQAKRELLAKQAQDEQARAQRQAELDRRKAESQKAAFEAKSAADKEAEAARAEAATLRDQAGAKVQEIRDQAGAADRVLEETNVREAGADAAATLEDRAAQFRDLSQKLKDEADQAAELTIDHTPTRDKQSRAQEFRDLILGRRDKLKAARSEAVGVTVDPVTGERSAAPFLENALAKESNGQSISDTKGFESLLNFVKERATDATRYGIPARSEYKKLLSELQPLAEDGETVLPIKFQKLLEERRLIESGRPDKQPTGYDVITSQYREDTLKAIDEALDSFGEGYKQFNKTYSEKSRPLDEFEFGVGKTATATRKFSRSNFEKNPETVLDTALSSPSRSSAQSLKNNFFDPANHGELENIILEEMVDRAKTGGYGKVLDKYGEFLEEFPNAKKTLLNEAERIGALEETASKTAAFKKRWADRVAKKAEAATKAIDRIQKLPSQVKTSLSSPLSEGALNDIAEYVRANPAQRDKVGAAMTDVLNSFDEKLVTNALQVPERQAALMRAGMSREQIQGVLENAQKTAVAKAEKTAELRSLRKAAGEAAGKAGKAREAGREAVTAEREKQRELGAEYQKLKSERAAAKGEAAGARAEFETARTMRVNAQQKRAAMSQLTPEMRDVINVEAEKIPLGTTEGLAVATTLTTIATGLGAVVGGAPLAGLLGAAGAAAGLARRKILVREQQKKISEEIQRVVSEILRDETGGVTSAIEKKISRAQDVAAAQRVANRAMTQLGFKPELGAVTAATIYNAYAKPSDNEPEPTGGKQPEAEAAPEEKAPEGGETYDIDKIIADRGASDLSPLIKSIYEQESASGKAAAASQENYAGAKGPMQVTRDTFNGLKRIGAIPKDYSFDNQAHLAEAGVALIQDLAKTYGNDPQKIAAAYYGGPEAVTESGIRRGRRDPLNPNAPTIGEYADKVLSRIIPTAQAGEQNMRKGGVVYSPAEQLLLNRYATR